VVASLSSSTMLRVFVGIIAVLAMLNLNLLFWVVVLDCCCRLPGASCACWGWFRLLDERLPSGSVCYACGRRDLGVFLTGWVRVPSKRHPPSVVVCVGCFRHAADSRLSCLPDAYVQFPGFAERPLLVRGD
jgi:hypothetical protein